MIELDQGGKAAADAWRAAVPAQLSGSVESLSIFREAGDDWKIVADDAPHLIFSISDRGARMRLVGSRSHAVIGNHSTRRLTAVVRLAPGTTLDLFGVPGAAIVDRGFDFDDVLPGRADPARLEEAAELGMDALSTELLALCAAGAEGQSVAGRDWMVGAVLSGTAPGEISARHGVSPRTLRRRVRDATGMAPATILRIRRLHRALLDRSRSGDAWARIAPRHGYSDQSHLIRDCRDLLGESPGAFVRRRHR